MTDTNRHILALSAQIVAAHAGHNQVATDLLPTVIRNVYSTLAGLVPPGSQPPALVRRSPGHPPHGGHDHAPAPQADGLPPAAFVHPTHGQTVFGDHLICMEDGLTMKMLKRHLLTVHGLTPDEYRTKWGLPGNYPMVAADYAKLRSNLALKSGLGLKPADRPAKKRKPGKD